MIHFQRQIIQIGILNWFWIVHSIWSIDLSITFVPCQEPLCENRSTFGFYVPTGQQSNPIFDWRIQIQIGQKECSLKLHWSHGITHFTGDKNNVAVVASKNKVLAIWWNKELLKALLSSTWRKTTRSRSWLIWLNKGNLWLGSKNIYIVQTKWLKNSFITRLQNSPFLCAG